MSKISEYIDLFGDSATTITKLKDISIDLPKWKGGLDKLYYPHLHDIVDDTINLKDKVHTDGVVEKSSRITLGLEKLLCKRMSEFTFAIPVRRVYSNIEDNETRKKIVKALEAIYKVARIDSENLRRGNDYYATCQLFTIWYAVKKPNTLYGFNSQYKLKCKTYSPMDNYKLYPFFDELGDMLAMSIEYTKKIANKSITYFETYTEDAHYIWKNEDAGNWEMINKKVSEDGSIVYGDEIAILKIPGAFICRKESVCAGISNLRSEIEYTLSRNSNVIAYNSAPIIKVAGAIKGQEKKNEAQRVWRVENGGDVSYVSWSQAIEALKYQVDTMLKLYWQQAQIPDISFENMKSLGNIGYDARQTLLTDAHLKIGDESGSWIEFLDRECNVIKAFLKLMNTEFASEVDNVEVEHIITPFIQNDELAEINKRMKANGGKAIESQLESITKYGQSDDAQATLEQIQKEQAEETTQRAMAFSMNQSV